MSHNHCFGGSDHQLRVYSNISELIANQEDPTPLVKLNKIGSHEEFQIYLKLERYNPFGSVKDRIALAMLNNLDRKGKTVIEPSSGNTGIALAALANAMDIPIEIAVPRQIPEEKKTILRLLGARLLEADDALCPLFPSEGARGLVNALINSPATRDKYVSPNQYENRFNFLAHYQSTGPEIWKQTRGMISHFFAGLGTCGTITGAGKYLKEQNPKIKIIAVEPSSPDHKLPGLKRITGLSPELVPRILDKSLIDELVSISDKEAYQTAIHLARREGILVGPTTGAILSAALQMADSQKGLAVVISPDDAFKYASFFLPYLDDEHFRSTAKKLDVSDLICPLSKIKATEFMDSLEKADQAEIIVGDKDSLKNIAQEAKSRGLKLDFKQANEDKFIIHIIKSN